MTEDEDWAIDTGEMRVEMSLHNTRPLIMVEYFINGELRMRHVYDVEQLDELIAQYQEMRAELKDRLQ